MSRQDGILVGLCLIAIILLSSTLLLLDPAIHARFLEAIDAAGKGAVIIFGLICAAIIVRIIRDSRTRVIRDGKDGQTARAVIHKGSIVQFSGDTVLDQKQQLEYAKQLMQMAGAIATNSKRITPLLEADEPKEIEGPSALPNYVRYEDVRPQVPQDHALVGVDGKGTITRDRSIKALTWVVGGSGSGKTNSVCIRVDEDYGWGHRFLVIDPHWFKEDSMYNAIKGYSDRFLMPVAYETEDILKVLDAFLDEFKRRKAGASWEFPITILIDEVGSLTADKPETDQEKEMVDKIKQVARICGQESRGFEMAGMYISQDAAGLAWLRKRAIMVLAHQLLMMSERLLACNQNVEIARDMDNWPRGRTLVYGIGFKEGQRVVQQPVFQPRIVEANAAPSVSTVSVPFPDAETAPRAKLRIIEGAFSSNDELSLKKEKDAVEAGIRETIKRMKKRGMADREIAPLVGLGGRKYSLYQQVCEEEGIVVSQMEESL